MNFPTTRRDLASALGLLPSDLMRLAGETVESCFLYRKKTVRKKNGRERFIVEPCDELKAVQRWILKRVVSKMRVHDASHAFRRGRSILTNAAVHSNSRTIVTFDLADFFPWIRKRRVQNAFTQHGIDSNVASVLAKLCTEETEDGVCRLPQGAPTSPGIANTICFRLDERLQHLSDDLGLRYSRYADDLTFSVSMYSEKYTSLVRFGFDVSAVVHDEGFRLNAAKTRVYQGGDQQIVTGLVVNRGHQPRLPRTLRRSIRAAVHNQTKHAPDDWSRSVLLGYLSYLHMTDPVLAAKLLKQLQAKDQSV